MALKSVKFYYSRDRGICCICGMLIASVEEANREHLVPKAHGGTDAQWNVAVAHIPCNTDRGCGCEGGQCRYGWELYRLPSPTQLKKKRARARKQEWRVVRFLEPIAA